MTSLVRLTLAAAVALVVTGCGGGAAPATDGAGPAPGSAASQDAGSAAASQIAQATASLEASTLGGGQFDFAGLDGTPTVLWFWAPWCTICRAEAPEVVATAQRLAGDVTLIGVPGRGPEGDMERFVSDTGTDGFAHVVDADGSIWSAFGVVGQPSFAFIDAAGDVEVVNGALTGEQLEQTARAMLG